MGMDMVVGSGLTFSPSVCGRVHVDMVVGSGLNWGREWGMGRLDGEIRTRRIRVDG